MFFSGPLLHCKSTSTWHIRLRGSEAYIFIVNHLIKFPLNPIHEKKVKIIRLLVSNKINCNEALKLRNEITDAERKKSKDYVNQAKEFLIKRGRVM